MQRRTFLKTAASLVAGLRASANAAEPVDAPRSIRVALIQFDAVPEQVVHNRHQMDRLARDAAAKGARWIVFHEGAVCDYTDRLSELAEAVPDGPSTQQMLALAKELDVCLSFGLSERDGERFYITQVFVGPQGLIHRYRKTWLWRSPEDLGFRNEWVRYDPGTGPELFEIDGVRASCFICADGNSQRCLDRLHDLHPQIVFHPNNRKSLGDPADYARRATAIGAPLLVPNRTGHSWMHACDGGSLIVAADGSVLARANREGCEEVLIHELQVTGRHERH